MSLFGMASGWLLLYIYFQDDEFENFSRLIVVDVFKFFEEHFVFFLHFSSVCCGFY